jgi:5-(carboxyamino)imidazole ribonucleotide mutase
MQYNPRLTRSIMAETRSSDLDKPLVGILTGSPSDLPVVEKAQEVLQALGIKSELVVLSAHRTPELVSEYLRAAPKRGVEVFIACAGMAAHLAGAVAAQTLLPVIGVPLTSGGMGGLDALLSTVQMPPGIPVATVAVDGAKNAAYLAARILAAGRPAITEKLAADLAEQQRRYDSPDKPRVR